MYMPCSQRHIHRYLVQSLVFIFTFYYCLLHISRNPKNGHPDVTDRDPSLKDSGLKRLKGSPFELQHYKLKVDFSSEEAGAKIIAQTKALLHVRSIQNNDRNSYLLAPCQKTDWFILSFPESISVKNIAFISYEYYASTYKVIRISASPLYPSEKWHILAEVETERWQSEVFDIASVCDRDEHIGCWAKYLKVEFLDFHDYEENYYCSLTCMKVYGSTAVDVLESEITNDSDSWGGNENIFEEFNARPEKMLQFSASVDKADLSLDPSKDATTINDLEVIGEEPSFIYRTTIGLPPMGHLKPTIRNTVLQFMAKLASRLDKWGFNRYLYAPLIRFAWRKQCAIRSLVSVMKERNNLGDYILGHNRHCWNMMLDVMLPIKHTWFEGVLHTIIKQGLLVLKNSMISKGVVSPPLLLCVRRCGFLGGFTCYSNFVYTSFATFTSMKKIKGFLPTYSPDLPLRRFYFFYSGSICRKKVPVSVKGVSDVFIGDGFIKGMCFTISDDNISSLTLSTNKCILNMKRQLVEDTENGYRLLDMICKTYVDVQGNRITKMTNNVNFVMLLLNSVNNLKAVRRSNNVHNVVVIKHEAYPLKMKEANNEDLLTDMPKVNVRSDIEPSNQSKRSQTHKHVLLQISERVKALEIFVNQLNQKVYQINDALKTYADYLHHLKSTQRIRSPVNHISKWGKNIEDEVELILKASGIQRVHIIFLHAVPTICTTRRECVECHVSSRFRLCTFFLNDEEGFAKTIRHSTCPISRLRPKRKRRSCRSIIPLSLLSVYIQALKRYRLLECCRIYGCECVHTALKDSLYLLWMPHFSKITGDSSKYTVMQRILYWIRMCIRYILSPSYVALGTILRLVFNIYTVSLCIICMQTFWLYRDRNNRMLICDIYERMNRAQGAKTNGATQII